MLDPQQKGARTSLRGDGPAISLAPLLQHLAAAIPPTDRQHPHAETPFLKISAGRLQIHTEAVLRRLVKNPDFMGWVDPARGGGFVHNATLPPAGQRAVVGGQLHASSTAALPGAIKKLQQMIEDELDRLVPGGLPSLGLLSSAPDYFQRLNQKPHVQPEAQSTVRPLQFGDDKKNSREKGVARVLVAREIIENRNALAGMEAAIRKKAKDLDADEIEELLSVARAQASREDSHTRSLLSFLEDQGLSRIRVEVGMGIMTAIRNLAANRTDKGSRYLVRYVDNVLALRSAYLDTPIAWTANLYQALGKSLDAELSTQLRLKQTYSKLPIWVDPVTQLVEFRSADNDSFSREVSYRFRTNGPNPQTKKSAFLSRLDELELALSPERVAADSQGFRTRMAATDLFFLEGAIPDVGSAGTGRAVARMQALLGDLAQAGAPAVIPNILARLRAANTELTAAAKAMLSILKKHTGAIIQGAMPAGDTLHLAVSQGVINWPQFCQAQVDGEDDYFNRPAGAEEKGGWFDYVSVTRNLSSAPNPLFSMSIKTVLNDRFLLEDEDAAPCTFKVSRRMSDQVLSVVLCPAAGDYSVRTGLHCTQGAGIDVLVSEDWLQRRDRPGSEQEKDIQKQAFSATVAAFTVLIYLTLWIIQKRLKPEQGDIRMLMLRLQQQGKNAEPQPGVEFAGSDVFYACAQAVELALSCDVATFMQGLALDHAPGNSGKHRDQGTLHALQAAFPLVMEGLNLGPDRVALINYSTRPSSTHPQFAGQDSYLYTAKTYVLNNAKDPQADRALLTAGRTQLHSRPQDSFNEPNLIFEEIARLHRHGYKHIILLWQHYGNRRIGRTADRHIVHSGQALLERVAEEFPAVTIYPMRRDVFSAIRLHDIKGEGDGYEVTRGLGHESFWVGAQAAYLSEGGGRKIIPAYTFATLAVVGGAAAAEVKAQSGFCTYFLEIDDRVSNRNWMERARSNLLDPNGHSPVTRSLQALLRGIHYLHAEREIHRARKQLRPVLDPHHWVAPTTIGNAGEVPVISSRRKGRIELSLPAVLAQVGAVLRGQHD